MRYRITAIEFDTDGDASCQKDLEKDWVGKIFDADSAEDAIARGDDIISDAAGWCVLSFSFVEETL